MDKRMTEQEQIQALLIQLTKQQAELQSLTKENEKLKKGLVGKKKTNNSSIYSVVRKSGKVVYGFTLRDENYKRIRRENFATKTEAETEYRRLMNLRDEHKLSTYCSNQNQRFQFFCDAYLIKARANFSINTLEAAEGIIKNHLQHFTDMKIHKINKKTAQEWSANVRNRMKPSAYNNTIKLAKAIWNNAISTDLTSINNPFSILEPINKKKERNVRKKIRTTKEENDILIETAEEMFHDYTAPIIACAAYGAMREGEILGLSWFDFDFKNNTISIERQVQKITKKRMKKMLEENPQLTEKDIILTDRLKTSASKDVIVVPERLIQIMRDYKKYLMTSGQYSELCFHKDGKPLVARDFIRYRFMKVLKKVFGDEKYMHFHELRGSCATILHLEGIPTKIIQKLLRHEKASTTEDIYIEVDNTSREVGQILDNVFLA